MFSKLSIFSRLTATLVASTPIALEERQSGCAPLIHIHAAGTSERGLGIVGNAFSEQLPSAVPGASVRALNYDTSAEYVVTVAAGARTLAAQLTSLSASCPTAKFSISGYSKGALVLHRTTLPAAVQAKVVSAAVFGDPQSSSGSRGIPLNDQSCFSAFCNRGDIFCSSIRTSIVPHLAYARDGSVDQAVAKIADCYN